VSSQEGFDLAGVEVGPDDLSHVLGADPAEGEDAIPLFSHQSLEAVLGPGGALEGGLDQR
jgi:hypothetical protein